VVINIDVVEQPTGDFSVMGGYSTAEGWLAEVSVQERNLLGTGRFARAAATYGQYIRSVELGYAEPYFLDTRSSMGVDLFAKETLPSSYLSYGTESLGGTLKWGLPIREDLSFQLRYSAFTQKITLPSYLNDCNNINPDFSSTFPTPSALQPTTGSPYPSTDATCFQYGQASLPVRVELANGSYLTSMFGYGLTYNTLDNNKAPTSGVYLSFGQDIAGAGGDVAYLRSTADMRSYYEVVTDLVSIVHLQAGDMIGLSKCPTGECDSTDGYVRMLDDFKMGPNLVRGFQPAGIGPRDITYGTTNDNIGGTIYWGASLEYQYPFYFLPKDTGFRGAIFVDTGSVWGYKGETQSPATGEINGTVMPIPPSPFVCQCGMQYADDASVRASVGASIIWDSPFGPLRFDFAYPFLKRYYDRTQFFAFGGGAQF
jgi:outer membrane protein insertion porin family